LGKPPVSGFSPRRILPIDAIGPAGDAGLVPAIVEAGGMTFRPLHGSAGPGHRFLNRVDADDPA
jgi:hypothetical protein